MRKGKLCLFSSKLARPLSISPSTCVRSLSETEDFSSFNIGITSRECNKSNRQPSASFSARRPLSRNRVSSACPSLRLLSKKNAPLSPNISSYKSNNNKFNYALIPLKIKKNKPKKKILIPKIFKKKNEKENHILLKNIAIIKRNRENKFEDMTTRSLKNDFKRRLFLEDNKIQRIFFDTKRIVAEKELELKILTTRLITTKRKTNFEY